MSIILIYIILHFIGTHTVQGYEYVKVNMVDHFK